MLTKEDLQRDLLNLGIEKGDIINVKASLKSIGLIKGGAKVLLESVLEVVGTKGTVVSEAFIKSYPLILLRKKTKYISKSDSPSYAGAFVNEMLRHPQSYRSSHPVQRFVAIGSDAKELMSEYSQINGQPYEVLRVMIERKAKNLRIGSLEKVVGVGTTHVAIDDLKVKQKRLPYGIYYYDNSQIKLFKPNWPSGCSSAFNALFPLYEEGNAILGKGKVGEAESMYTDMQRTYSIELSAFKRDLKSLMCGDPGCAKCRIGWEFSNGYFWSTLMNNIKRLDMKKVIQTVSYQLTNNYQPQ